MKLDIEIGGDKRTIDIDEDAGRFRLSIDDRVVEGEVLRPEPGAYTFFVGDRVVDVRVSEGIRDTLRVQVGAYVKEISVVNRRSRVPGKDGDAEGRQALLAPMPGKVVAVLADPGTSVEHGQGIIVVEAMKMQNEVKTPKAGIVAEVRVAIGDTVAAGQVLAVVE